MNLSSIYIYSYSTFKMGTVVRIF